MFTAPHNRHHPQITSISHFLKWRKMATTYRFHWRLLPSTRQSWWPCVCWPAATRRVSLADTSATSKNSPMWVMWWGSHLLTNCIPLCWHSTHSINWIMSAHSIRIFLWYLGLSRKISCCCVSVYCQSYAHQWSGSLMCSMTWKYTALSLPSLWLVKLDMCAPLPQCSRIIVLTIQETRPRSRSTLWFYSELLL